MKQFVLHGGRGAMSSATGNKMGLFGSGGKGGNSQELFPSQVNRLNKTGDVGKLTDHFADLHNGKKSEFAITIDKNGYATSYTSGGSGSVQPNMKYVEQGSLVVHNHPASGWSNFSGQDLEFVASTKARGIVATSAKATAPKGTTSATTKKAYSNRKDGTYSFEKQRGFKSSEFKKAIHKVKVSDTNYDKELGNWLEKNQKKYGYKYSYKPNKK